MSEFASSVAALPPLRCSSWVSALASTDPGLKFVAWFASGGGAIAALAAVVISVLLMAVVPKPIRKRLRVAVVLGLMGALLDIAMRQVHRFFPDQKHNVLQAIGFVCAALAIGRLLVVFFIDVVVERGGRKPINRINRDITQSVVYLLGAIAALQAGEIDATSLIATTTVASAVIGLSAQESLGNLFAGLAIGLERPIAVGDWIRIDKSDFTGRVVSVSWRSVTIVTDDRAYFVVPNSVFSKTAFSNFSRPGGAVRRSLYFTFPFEFAPAQVHEALLAACADSPELLKDPAPSVFTWTYGDNGITYWLRYFIADYARRDPSQADVTARIWYELHRKKMPAAMPLRQTYLHQVDQAAAAAAAAEVIRDRRAAIDAVDFLKPLAEASKQRLAEGGHRRLFGPGETILRQGERGRTFYMIRRGTVAIITDGKEKRRLGKGDFFGELALLTGSERTANVVTTEETEVFEIDENIFREVLRADPRVVEDMSHIVAQRRAEIDRDAEKPPPSVHDVHRWGTEILAKIKDLFALD